MTAAIRKRMERALAEIYDHVSEPMPDHQRWPRLGLLMDAVLGLDPACRSPEARWLELGPVELAILVEALEERAAIVNDGPHRFTQPTDAKETTAA